MKIVSEFPQRTPRSKYPWNEWFDGQIRAFAQDDLPTISLDNFRVMAQNTAQRMGKKLKTRRHDGVLYIQAFDREEG